MKLDKVALGLAAGLLWGLCLFICTVWVMYAGGGEHFSMLGRFYLGYSVSWVGAFVGLIYGFIDGFICGWLFGWLYNRFSKA